IREKSKRIKANHMPDKALVQQTWPALERVSPAHFVVDIQQASQKVAPVKPHHPTKVSSAVATLVESFSELLASTWIVKLIEQRIAFNVTHFKSLVHARMILQSRIESFVGILEALTKG